MKAINCNNLSVEGGLLSESLNETEIYLLKNLKSHPHRFDPTAFEAPTVALMISKLFALDLVHVDKVEDGHGCIVSLSKKGLNFICKEKKKLTNYSH